MGTWIDGGKVLPAVCAVWRFPPAGKEVGNDEVNSGNEMAD
jgi:hypothetical protein